jgi:D-arabinitol dehydrogenase (NADP+)
MPLAGRRFQGFGNFDSRRIRYEPMKAVVYDRPGAFVVKTIPDPSPGPHEVLIKVLAAGVCGTDLHLHHGEFGPTYPLIPGHEVMGEVVECGTEVSNVNVGQRVCVDNTVSCGGCGECRRGKPVFCETLVAHGVNAPGGFAELYVSRADRCFVVDDLANDVAVFAEPTACVVHGLDMLEMQPGSNVLLYGAGPTGLILTQLLASSGAGTLTVAAPTQTKLDLAKRRGADHTVQMDRNDSATCNARLREIAPAGFDVVVDATGVLSVLEQAIPLTRTGGMVFVYGMTNEADLWAVSPYEIFRREITVRGSFAQQFAFDRSLMALRSGRVNTDEMITHRFGLDEYQGALNAITDSTCIKSVVYPNG